MQAGYLLSRKKGKANLVLLSLWSPFLDWIRHFHGRWRSKFFCAHFFQFFRLFYLSVGTCLVLHTHSYSPPLTLRLVNQSTPYHQQHWKWQRQHASKIFTVKAFRQYTNDVFVQEAQRAINYLDTFADTGKVVELQQLFYCFTLGKGFFLLSSRSASSSSLILRSCA